MPFEYMLRLSLQPGFHIERKLNDAIDFCEEALIDDVIFFIGVEELSNGFLTKEETMPWLEMIAHAKSILELHNITVSINPWMTLGHADRGRQMNPKLPFDPITDRDGYKSTSQACPLSPKWREYLKEIYSLYASIKPYIIWIDDDFRLHNHSPLNWGGCFCDLHMKEYSRRAGTSLTRDDFVNSVIAPGEPHPYRKIWLETSEQTIADIAKIIGDAVHSISSETRVGLMSSSPEVHCAEGRNWQAIMDGFTGGKQNPANRPHLPAYREVIGQNYVWGFNTISRRTEAAVPNNTDLYPELESWQDTRFTKSHRFTRYQIESSVILGAKGITMNIFDMMGNGVMLNEGYQKPLAEAKSFVERAVKLNISRSAGTGVNVLASSKSSATIHTSYGRYMEELYPNETLWAGLLSSYGIANKYMIDELPENGVAAISGQYLRNSSESQIRKLFNDCKVIIDGDTAQILAELGCGDLAGIECCEWHLMDSGFQTYEQVCDGARYCGLDETRISCQSAAGDLLKIDYTDGTEIHSIIKNPAGESVANGIAVYKNKVFVLPYGHFGITSSHLTHLNPLRQEMIQRFLFENTGAECPIFTSGNAYVSLYTYEMTDKNIIVIVNSSGDDVGNINIYAPKIRNTAVSEINRTETIPADVSFDDGWILYKSEICNYDTRFLVFNK